MNLTHLLSTSRAARFVSRIVAVTLLLIGGFALRGHPVSAATKNGVATISHPISAQPIASGGSAEVFTVALPGGAACSGDTANQGFHVYSYLVPKGTNVGTLTFVNAPSAGFGLFDSSGSYYGSANTAINTGQVIGIPNNLTWAPLVTGQVLPLSELIAGGTGGKWDAGLACANTTGAVTDWWNTEVTFTADGADANGFTWAATPGLSTGVTTTTKPGATTTTTRPRTTTTVGGGGATTTTTIGSAGGTTTTVVVSGGGVTPIPVDGYSDPAAVGGELPRTGSPVRREVGFGLLAIGAGMMLIGLELRWKVRGAFAR